MHAAGQRRAAQGSAGQCRAVQPTECNACFSWGPAGSTPACSWPDGKTACQPMPLTATMHGAARKQPGPCHSLQPFPHGSPAAPLCCCCAGAACLPEVAQWPRTHCRVRGVSLQLQCTGRGCKCMSAELLLQLRVGVRACAHMSGRAPAHARCAGGPLTWRVARMQGKSTAGLEGSVHYTHMARHHGLAEPLAQMRACCPSCWAATASVATPAHVTCAATLHCCAVWAPCPCDPPPCSMCPSEQITASWCTHKRTRCSINRHTQQTACGSAA